VAADHPRTEPVSRARRAPQVASFGIIVNRASLSGNCTRRNRSDSPAFSILVSDLRFVAPSTKSN
jgi:hypothetical protein